MPTTNFDASLTTARRRQLSLYGWRKTTNYPDAGLTNIKKEQAYGNGFKDSGPTAEVPLNVKVGAGLVGQSGACECSTAVTLAGYRKISPGC
jgi:hypothetical protein